MMHEDERQARAVRAFEALEPDLRKITDVREMAKTASPSIMLRVIEIALTGTGGVAANACHAVLDRAHGKPPQAIEHSGKDGQPIEISDARNEIADAVSRLAAAVEAEKNPSKSK